MNTISISHNNLSLVQSFIRHYIGDSQYVDSLILTMSSNNKIVKTFADEELIELLQNPSWENIDQTIMYTVSLKHVYQYHFVYNDENISVNIIIQKNSQNIIPNNIPSFNWDNISEECFMESDNDRFMNEIQLAIYLKTPDIEHYHLPDKSVFETIEMVTETTSNDKFYSKYLQNKGLNQAINPKVFQVTGSNLQFITDNINQFTANMKTDGIRTLVVIYNNVIMCYQRDFKFLYLHDLNIEGNYIFDCELCLGRLHIFDCYVFEDNDISTEIYTYRVDKIHEFTDKYTIFIGTEYISGSDCLEYTYMFKKQASMFDEYFNDVNFTNVLQVLMSVNITDNTIENINKYINTLKQLENDTRDNEYIQKYINNLISMLKDVNANKYKSSLGLCRDLKISNHIIFAYSPVVIEGLIGYYNQIGFTSSENNIKKYSINFVANCRQNNAIIPVSFTEKIINMYKNYNYPNDGVIFTHNVPVIFENISNKTIYYKWKPRDQLSADVKLVFDNSNVNLLYDNKRYVMTNIMYNDNYGKEILFNNMTTELELNNFNKMLPVCKNGDIIQSGNIVEVVPLWNGREWSYILLKIRYDKIRTNAYTTINNIYEYQRNFIDILLS